MEKIDDKLIAIRKLIADNKLDGYILPKNDEHSSEYLPDFQQRVRYLTGFSGSNALVFVS